MVACSTAKYLQKHLRNPGLGMPQKEGLKAQGREILFMGQERGLSELKSSGMGSWQGCKWK